MTNPAGLDGEGRLQALAVLGARQEHYRVCADSCGIKEFLKGHLGRFEDCPHPDCVLVRSVPAAPPPQAESEIAMRIVQRVKAGIRLAVPDREIHRAVVEELAAIKSVAPPLQEQPQEKP